MAVTRRPPHPLHALFTARVKAAGVAFSKQTRCWIREKTQTLKRIRFSGLTKLIAPTYLGRKHAKYDQTGYVPGISSASRGNAFDRSVQRYIQRGASPADTFELRKFLEDVRTLGFQIVGAQVPAWNESDVQLASATTPAGVRAVCTAADVVLFCPETAGKKATIAVVECKTGSVGPGLDRPLSGRSLYATPVGPFAHEAGKPGPERTPITRALLHDIQAAATAQLLQQTYGFLDQFNVEIYVVYVDRLAVGTPLATRVATWDNGISVPPEAVPGDPTTLLTPRRKLAAVAIGFSTSVLTYVTWTIIFDQPFVIPHINDSHLWVILGLALTVYATFITTYLSLTLNSHLQIVTSWMHILFAPVFLVLYCSTPAKVLIITTGGFVTFAAIAAVQNAIETVFVVCIYLALVFVAIFCYTAVRLFHTYELVPKAYPYGRLGSHTEQVFVVGSAALPETGERAVLGYVVDTSKHPLFVERTNGGIMIRSGREETVIQSEPLTALRAFMFPFAFVSEMEEAFYERFEPYWRRRIDRFYTKLLSEYEDSVQ